MGSYLNATDYSDEEYIDMEVFSQDTIFCHSKSSPTNPNIEFEFQTFSSSSEKDTTTSPADELFCDGKLLPLYLPPRLQMVGKLLQNHAIYESKLNQTISCEEFFSTPLFTTSSNTSIAATPFESYHISSVESCQVSRELHRDEYLQDYLAEKANYQTGDDDQNTKKFWTKRLKLIKQSALNSKLKVSRAYLKSIFTKSGCSDRSSAIALRNVNEPMVPKAEICGQRHAIVATKVPFCQTTDCNHQITSSDISRSFSKEDNEKDHHRRSFSGVFKRLSSSKYTSSESSSRSSSTSSSNNSNGFQDMQFLKRSISANLDVENSIQAAIAHCKKSQQQFHSGKTN